MYGDPTGLLDSYSISSDVSLWEVDGSGYLETSNNLVVAGAISAESSMWGYQTNVTVWSVESGKVLWMKYLKYVEILDIALSPDGNTLTGLFYNGYTQVIDWDVSSGDQLGVWNNNDNGGRALVVANTVSAIIDDATLVIIEKATGKMLWNDTFDFSTSTVCISSDGSSVAYGFEAIELLTLNGNSYSEVWNVGTSGPESMYFAGACAIEAGNVAVGWYSDSYNQNQVTLYTTQSSTPVYTYNYPSTTDSCQDLPIAAAMTDDGAYFVMGSWGDCSDTVPQTNVFSTAATGGTAPAFSYTGPGSVFSADIITTGNHVYATSCGKHVHANQFGDGGDVFAIQIV